MELKVYGASVIKECCKLFLCTMGGEVDRVDGRGGDDCAYQ